jgi:hypothetical protein
MLDLLAGERRHASWRFHYCVLILPALFGNLIIVNAETTPKAPAWNSAHSTGSNVQEAPAPDQSPSAFQKTQHAESGSSLVPEHPATFLTESEDVTETPQLALPIEASIEEVPHSSLEPKTSQESDEGVSISSEAAPVTLEANRDAIRDPYVVEPDDYPFFFPIFGSSFNPWWQAEGLKFRLGIFHVRLSLGLVSEYNDNIYYTATDRVGDLITSLTSFLVIGAGDWIDRVNNFALLEYNPALQFYAQHSAENNSPQNLIFTSKFGAGRLINKFRILYILTNTPTADQVGLHEYQTLDAALVNSYRLGGRTLLQNTFRVIYQDDYAGISYLTLSTAPRLDYEIHDKLALFFEPYAGLVFTEGGPSQPYEGLNLGFKYSTLSKLTVQGSLGFEAYQTGGAATEVEHLIAPTFDLTLTYAVRQTAISLNLNREVQHSGFVSGQTYINNALSFIAKQRVLGKIDLRLDLQYQILEYQGLGTNSRTDTFLVAVPRIDYLFWKDQAAFSIYYRIQQRYSEIPSIAYRANILGVAIRWNF